MKIAKAPADYRRHVRHTRRGKFRRFIDVAKRVLGLALLVIEVLKRLLELFN